jgi:ATP-dependent Clp protease ATP-binding subunit ClpC
MHERYTDRARKVMDFANQEAWRFNHEYIGTEHILLGLVKEGSGVAANVLQELGIDLRKIQLEVEKIVQAGPNMATTGKLPRTPRTERAIKFASEEARNLGHNYVGTEHLLLGLLREGEGVAAQVLMNLGLSLEAVREQVLGLLGHNMDSGESGGTGRTADKRRPKTPALDSFGRDLTELARQGKLDPVIGRQNEIERVLRILCRRTKRCALLLGEAGVGKTAIIRGLAQLLAGRSVPPLLADFRVVALDLAALLAGLGPGDHLATRLKAIVNEVRLAGLTVLVLDDLHLWAAHQAAFSGLLVNLGDIPYCIAATTPAEFSRVLTKESTLGGYFVPVPVSPVSRDAVLDILRGLRDRLEAHHRVRITDEALDEALACAAREEGGTSLVARALDVVDEAAACVRFRATALPRDLKDVEAQIEQLTREKEEAVAEQDFDTAARLRDQADKLMKRVEVISREWRERTGMIEVVVDAAAVREVIGTI